MDGSVRGKLPYMAPEQLTVKGESDRRTDVYAASVVLWELLTGRLPLTDEDVGEILEGKPRPEIPPPSALQPGISPELDAVVLRGMAPERDARFATAMDMATALERAQTPASQRLVAEWVREVGRAGLEARAALIDALERRAAPARSPGGAAHGLATGPCSEGTIPAAEQATVMLGRARARSSELAPARDVDHAEEPAALRARERHLSIPPTAVTPEPPPKRAVWRATMMGATAAIATLVVAVGLSSRLAGAPLSASPHEAHASVPAPAPPAADTVPPAIQSPAPAAARVSAPVAVKPKKASTSPARSSSLGMCEVPFRVDDDGVRIPKPGCW
jgi:serine/threonine-protein kinase